MKFIKEEKLYHYAMPQLERLVLMGVIAKIIEDGEIKVNDNETKEVLENILNGLKG